MNRKQQESKLKSLESRGGKLIRAECTVEMPDGEIATIDEFGRVTWRKEVQPKDYEMPEIEFARITIDEFFSKY